MSLFLRLWLMSTITALAAGAIAIGAYVFVTEQQRLDQARQEAFNVGRLLGSALSSEFSAHATEDDALGLLAERADQLMASGRLLSITMTSPDRQRMIKRTLPGLESEEAFAVLGGEPFAQAIRQPITRLYDADNAFYVLTPVFDDTGAIRIVTAIGLPAQPPDLSDGSRRLFISLAVSLSLALGLVAAWALTVQIGRPIRLLATAADRLEAGAFDSSGFTPLIDRHDEIGKLARTVLRLVQALDYLALQMERQQRLREAESAETLEHSGSGRQDH